MAEQTQSAINRDRAKHPLNFFYDVISVALAKVNEQVSYHKNMREKGDTLIDHAVRHLNNIGPLAQNCSVTAMSATTAKVQYHDAESSVPHKERVVDLLKKTCACRAFQDRRAICLHGLAAGLKKHATWNRQRIFKEYSGAEYIVADDEEHTRLAGINAAFELCSIPADDALAVRTTIDPDIVRHHPLPSPARRPLADEQLTPCRTALQMAWAAADDAEASATAAAPEPTLRAPPPRNNSHGGNKHKRKVKGRGRGTGNASRGKQSTRSSAVTAAQKKEKRLTCSKCSAAARMAPAFNVTNHRGNACPYEKADRIEMIDLTVEDDDDKMDEDEPQTVSKQVVITPEIYNRLTLTDSDEPSGDETGSAGGKRPKRAAGAAVGKRRRRD